MRRGVAEIEMMGAGYFPVFRLGQGQAGSGVKRCRQDWPGGLLHIRLFKVICVHLRNLRILD